MAFFGISKDMPTGQLPLAEISNCNDVGDFDGIRLDAITSTTQNAPVSSQYGSLFSIQRKNGVVMQFAVMNFSAHIYARERYYNSSAVLVWSSWSNIT